MNDLVNKKSTECYGVHDLNNDFITRISDIVSFNNYNNEKPLVM